MANKFIRGFNSMIIMNIKLAFQKYILRKKILFSPVHVISPGTKIEVEKGGCLSFGKMVNIIRAHLIVRGGAVLDIKNRVFMNAGVIVTCREKVVIGENTLFGPNVLIYDHDHSQDEFGNIERKKFVTKPIVIGKNCWIGAGTTILKGTVIGDNSTVGAGCVLNGVYPENSVIVQKRETSVIPKYRPAVAGAEA